MSSASPRTRASSARRSCACSTTFGRAGTTTRSSTAIDDDERSALYGEAFAALAHAGNRYRIRQVFGSRRHGGGDNLGAGVPALIVFENGEPVDVYPHQIGDGYRTIRDFLNSL